MSLASAIEALKDKDYALARTIMSRETRAAYTSQHFLVKGLAEMALEDWSAAQATFVAATDKFPKDSLFWLNRGISEENLGLADASIASHEKCLSVNPQQGEAYGNLSNLYRKKNRFAEAEEMARKALANGAGKGDALNCLGLALAKQGKFTEADNAYRQAQQQSPDNSDIVANRANLAIDQLHFDEAWKFFAEAREREDKPVYRHDEALARLLSGDYERGFELFESRLELPTALRLHPTCPRWQGENLHGKKLLILAEQGFGDVIQFCRYEKLLPDGDLIWAVPKGLVRLLSGAVRGSVLCENDPLPTCDYYVPILSLPWITKHTQPVVADKILTALTTPRLPQGKHHDKIGLVWAGSPTHERDHERSIKLDLLAALFEKIAADFYAPFSGKALDQIAHYPVIRLDHLITDFADTAALLKQMDCLVTVDTAAAHLAGTLGVKTFLLLAHCPDWRWRVEGQNTTWYPSLTLIRQSVPGVWGDAIERLANLLKTPAKQGLTI